MGKGRAVQLVGKAQGCRITEASGKPEQGGLDFTKCDRKPSVVSAAVWAGQRVGREAGDHIRDRKPGEDGHGLY